MVAIAAFHVGAIGVQVDNPNVNPEQFNTALPTPELGRPIDGGNASLRISGQPITLSAHSVVVFHVQSFEDDFYDRIWRIPESLDFGYVPSLSTRSVKFWNAWYSQSVTLTSIDALDDEGLTLDADTPPQVFLPSEQRTYSVDATPDGPPNIDATYTFNFGSVPVPLSVTGVRIVPWTYEPNWIEPVLERPSWLTDVQTHHDGSEQRRQLRGGARVEWQFTYDVDGDRRRLIENEIFAFGSRIWAVPVFTDEQQLGAPLAIGAQSIPVAAAGMDYHVGGLGMLLLSDGTAEAFQVDAIGSDSIDLKSQLELAWPANSKVFPARACYLLDPRGYSRFTREYVRGIARFQTAEEVDAEELIEATYRGRPVLTDEPNWLDAPTIDFAHKIGRVDYNVGRAFVFDHAGIALPAIRVLWTALDRAESEFLHQFIWARRGRQKSLWVPTWSADLRVLAYDNSTAHLDVAFCGLVDLAAASVHRKDLRIQLTDGSVLYRRITSVATVVEGVSERAFLDQSLGQVLTSEQFDRLSWLILMRLDQDTVEIAWSTQGTAQTVLSFKGPKHAV
jgi:hypothetical protein